jgi:hypothetical protein
MGSFSINDLHRKKMVTVIAMINNILNMTTIPLIFLVRIFDEPKEVLGTPIINRQANFQTLGNKS